MSKDSREQFEQAYSDDNGGVPVGFIKLQRQGVSYSVPKVARAWYWWKRSREAVVVVLPKLAPYHKTQAPDSAIHIAVGYENAMMLAAQAIEAAGVKVAT